MHAWPGLVQPVPYMNGIVDCSTSTTFSFGGGTWDDLHCKCLDPIQAAFQRLPQQLRLPCNICNHNRNARSK